jgi:hypothetical protein
LSAGCGQPAGGITESESALSAPSVAGNPNITLYTFDGYPAYGCTGGTPYCGDFDVYTDDGKNTSTSNPGGWFKSEGGYGYQCAELATRYFYGRYGVTGWSFMYAKDMCDSHPSSVSVTNNPVPGDLIVFGPNACPGSGIGFAGHVAVIDQVNASTVSTTQQNPALNINWNRSCASCYLHANNNNGNGGGSGTKCSQSEMFNSEYQGRFYWTCDLNHDGNVYICDGASNKETLLCSNGCQGAGVGKDDHCTPPLPKCSQSEMFNSEYQGRFYWTCDLNHDGNAYICAADGDKQTKLCAKGCHSSGIGADDQCN